ncbi:PQQ-dependent sugar dehydrogenase [Frigoriglobus tundricola]|uniref:L-sorbosone dehydrogenase, distantly related to a bacterial beta-galactosidase n=1 Tax=Frigoriglobus tundricola TaxID=2774151 RepID=A0A6M5YZU7_9BACT|nr:sorbosone dehydrogenase family protein [Frigoriglobus tundricola]QJW98731.1 L-sorbosone dehydrogenase, distantly related to a bacterial beta-galactosidase [Frigoriglobus tundricola]
MRAILILAPITLPVLMARPEPPKLPKPFETPSVVNRAKVIGWPEGRTPKAPPGFTVTPFAADVETPRWFHQLPNGDVLVSEARTVAKKKDDETKAEGSPNRVSLYRDGKKHVLLKGLNQPFGMALRGDRLFVGVTDGVLSFPYETGATAITAGPIRVTSLPAGGYNNHWTRNVLFDARGEKLYVTVGSGSNVGENGIANEMLRANVLQMNPDGTALRVFASGLRNPVGLAWQPQSGRLWTAVNERDELGDELVPDYLAAIEDGQFYGWPWYYFGKNEDPRRKGERPDLAGKVVVPDLALGSHTASLGLAFCPAKGFGEKYQGGAFIGQHGSWNRSSFVGYRVAFVPFKNGKPAGEPEDFLTGFVANDKEVYGRPVGVAFLADGSLLVADDAGNRVWRVTRDR